MGLQAPQMIVNQIQKTQNTRKSTKKNTSHNLHEHELPVTHVSSELTKQIKKPTRFSEALRLASLNKTSI